ncbi:unnamed protein product [Caenorhabditis sp. 36 PRJEB53466]|nr:unnamed protein product [Caenorhabditis sp. 36 PRJEB53466]
MAAVTMSEAFEIVHQDMNRFMGVHLLIAVVRFYARRLAFGIRFHRKFLIALSIPFYVMLLIHLDEKASGKESPIQLIGFFVTTCSFQFVVTDMF